MKSAAPMRPITMFLRLFAAMALCAAALPAAAVEDTDPWPDLAKQIFNGAPLKDGTGLVALDAPVRAEDAAIVPVTMTVNLPPGDPRRLVALTLVIDRNPAPLAGVFHPGPKISLTALSTRVRVDAYTNIHVVAELSDGRFYVAERFVKASGGCSAPMLKDPKDAEAQMGQIKLRQFARDAGSVAPPDQRDVQVMVRHPNNSGMQMDQVTRLYVPPLYIDDFKLWQGDDLVLSMEGGISISEDPNLRLSYGLASTSDFRIEAVDSGNHAFAAKFPNKNPGI
jgi:sulfur-oxidizing protein SoxY